MKVSRISGVIEKQLHIGLVSAHRRMGEVANTAQMPEEIIGIGHCDGLAVPILF